MELLNYSLKVGNKKLFDNVNLLFSSNKINHILGSNGAGKSSFAKSCVGMLKYEGKIVHNGDIILIGSGSNVPQEFTISDVTDLLKKRFDGERVNELYTLLKMNNISDKLKIRKMSDGQKQKIKLLCFLSAKPQIVILDEFTNALDRMSAIDLYSFFNEYIKIEDLVVLNITHNLSDLEYMQGNYYYIKDRDIVMVDSKKQVIESYMRGE